MLDLLVQPFLTTESWRNLCDFWNGKVREVIPERSYHAFHIADITGQVVKLALLHFYFCILIG